MGHYIIFVDLNADMWRCSSLFTPASISTFAAGHMSMAMLLTRGRVAARSLAAGVMARPQRSMVTVDVKPNGVALVTLNNPDKVSYWHCSCVGVCWVVHTTRWNERRPEL